MHKIVKKERILIFFRHMDYGRARCRGNNSQFIENKRVGGGGGRRRVIKGEKGLEEE